MMKDQKTVWLRLLSAMMLPLLVAMLFAGTTAALAQGQEEWADRIAEIETETARLRIEIDRLGQDDDRSDLMEQLNALAIQSYELRNEISSDEHPDLYQRAEEARRALIELLKGSFNVMDLSTGLTGVEYDQARSFGWQWNDQYIQQEGALRPTGGG